MPSPLIHYTNGDESPALATASLYPILDTLFKPTGIGLTLTDISLAGRILAQFSDRLSPEQQVADGLAHLGKLVHTQDAVIIKVPNISASIPQLKAAIAELQSQGYAIPDFPESPRTDVETDIANRYRRVIGSAVNPVLRQGNSDRRAPRAVKAYARQHPPQMGAWKSDSKTHVASMSSDDFYGNEQATTISSPTSLTIQFTDANGAVRPLKANIPLTQGDIVDATVMRADSLYQFLKSALREAKQQSVLFSIHLKATMMKVSDPIMFGIAVRVFFEPVFEKHHDTFNTLGVNPNNGLIDILDRINTLDQSLQDQIQSDIDACINSQAPLAMVDDTTTILHAPNNVIIDASMPAMIRDSGKMWNTDGQLQDTKAIIPDRTYAGVYDAVIEDCKRHGAVDPKTMGSVSNIGLMAEQAEEYGSHDTTFQMAESGEITVIDETGKCLFQHTVHAGDIWRMCRVKHTPIMNWIQLGIDRCLSTNTPAVFFLDKHRPHDRELIKKVTHVQDDHTGPLDIHVLSPKLATQFTLTRLRAGLDTISVTGNVLRDYLTDLFPILELGTSSKMQSIVPLLSGGGLFETGAGGSAPRHIQQFLKDGHLRWNSLGEFLAISACLAHIHTTFNMASAGILSRCLDTATEQILLQDCAPMPNPGERDTLETHFYLAQYWTQALHEHGSPLGDQYSALYQSLTDNESQIVSEFRAAQGTAKHIGGYYHPSPDQLDRLLRPSPTFNQCLQNWAANQ